MKKNFVEKFLVSLGIVKDLATVKYLDEFDRKWAIRCAHYNGLWEYVNSSLYKDHHPQGYRIDKWSKIDNIRWLINKDYGNQLTFIKKYRPFEFDNM